MYYNNINLNLTFLGFFLITNVFGAPGAWQQSLDKTLDSDRENIRFSKILPQLIKNVNKEVTENMTFSKILPQLRKNVNKEVTENNTIALGYNVPTDDPKFGKLENLLC